MSRHVDAETELAEIAAGKPGWSGFGRTQDQLADARLEPPLSQRALLQELGPELLEERDRFPPPGVLRQPHPAVPPRAPQASDRAPLVQVDEQILDQVEGPRLGVHLEQPQRRLVHVSEV